MRSLNSLEYKIDTNVLLIGGNVVEFHYSSDLLIDDAGEAPVRPYLSNSVKSSSNLSQNPTESLNVK